MVDSETASICVHDVHRNANTGEWSQLGANIVTTHTDQWYASAKVPDGWFSC